jgi:N-acetylmuramic acid 6-phosphate etherase
MTIEGGDPRFADLDAWPTHHAMMAMWEGQMAAAAAVQPILGALAAAADAAAARLKQKGRIIYVGAGTSGRIAVQDGTELGPTFSWPRDRLVYVLAGGDIAFIESVEGAEDDAEEGASIMRRISTGSSDVVVGVAASGTTPFTVAAIAEARLHGALTIGMAGHADAPLLLAAELGIALETGPEVLAGSTRMKAGTAQKIALNLLSTAIMIRLGRTYRGEMVLMRPQNTKLRVRSIAIVMRITHCDTATAEAALQEAKGDMRLAILIVRGHTRENGSALLETHNGNLRAILG